MVGGAVCLGSVASGGWGRVYDPVTKTKRWLGTVETRREALDLEANWRTKAKGTSRETCERFASDGPLTTRDPVSRRTCITPSAFKCSPRTSRASSSATSIARLLVPWAQKHQGSLPAVRAMFSDAVRDGLVASNPFANLRRPAWLGGPEAPPGNETELGTVADLALDPRMELEDYAPQYRALVLFAGYTGVRPGELFALRRDDVRGQLATVERSLSSKTHKVGPTKTGRSRAIIVPPVAQDALLEVPTNRLGLLFVSPTGVQWSQSLHHRYWSRLRLLANLSGWDFYGLRHTAATMLLERGVSPWDVAIQLGHTDGGQLVQTLYGHPSHDGARARMLSAWDQANGPTPIVSGANRGQATG